jgi:hypothetical protein
MRLIQLLYTAAEQHDKPLAEKYKKIYEDHMAQLR